MLRLQKYFSVLLLCLAFLLCSCGGGGKSATQFAGDSIKFKYAKLIHVYKLKNCRLVEIKNPWKPNEILNRYVLVKQGEKTQNLPQGIVLHIPLHRLTVFTSVHCSALNDLHALDNVTGVCDFDYIELPEVIRRVKEGRIGNMGNALNPNVELILSGKTDGMLVSPFEKSGYGALERTSIPLIECADYMETSALGRAEWIRFFGMLVGREREADSLFNKVEQNYHDLVSLAAKAKEKPTVFCDCMMGAAWYQPGGQSTIGKLYSDAGAKYIFSDYPENGSVRLSFETVYSKAHDAQFWLLKYGRSEDYTYASLQKEKAQYANFAAFKNHKIYGCNTLRVAFFDNEPFHPDIFLADAIKVFHPELLPNHQFKFLKPLQ